MPTADPPSLGAMLREARERAGLSVNDVAERTRIRATLIREIEADDFSGCSGNFYARGHVRSIATILGLDPAPFVSRFNMQAEMTQPIGLPVLPAYEPVRTRGGTSKPPKVRSRLRAPRVRAGRRGPNWTSAMLVAAAVVAILAVGSFVFAAVQQRPIKSIEAGRSQAPSAPPTAPPTTAPPVPHVPPAGVNLRLLITAGSSWVRVTDGSGGTLFQGVLNSGAVKDFSDPKSLTVRYGNSRAVSVVLNGQDRGSPSSSCGGNVCTQQYK